MTQLLMFDDPAVTGICPDCGRELLDLYSSSAPIAEWNRGQDWTHGAIWKICDCSPRTPRACVPAPDPEAVA